MYESYIKLKPNDLHMRLLKRKIHPKEIERIKTEYDKPMTVVATGGMAHLFRPDLPLIDHIDPDLTMRGLMLIHARNAKRS